MDANENITLPDSRMKLAFVGASGYGNVGDDTYPLVFAQHFPDCERLIFNSDRPLSMPDDIDMLVIGGGGLLYNAGVLNQAGESPHFRCMKFYMDWAIQNRIPWGILSCGFQFRPQEKAPHADVLRPWIPYLENARFITLRSPVCRQIAEELTGRDDVKFFPDLGCLYRSKNTNPACAKEDLLTIIPAGLINPRNALVQHFIRLFTSMRYGIQWLSMGAPIDDTQHLDEAAKQYPDAVIIARPGPERAFKEIARSRMILSGRYHGMVFARSCRIPFFVPQEAPHKIMSEDWAAVTGDAIGHITTLRSHLATICHPS